MPTVDTQALYKTLYPQGYVPDSTYTDYPMLALLTRNEKFFGSVASITLKYGNNSGRSSSFTKAKQNQDSTKNVAFTVMRKPDYALATLKNEDIEASENDAGALVRLFQNEVDGAHASAAASEAQSFAGDGSGIIGQFAVGTTLTGAVAILRDPEQITNFELGNNVQLCDGPTTLRTGALKIIEINRNTGSLKFNANINTISGATANDYLVIEGDHMEKPTGFDGWIPVADPSSSPFFGVDRTKDIVRLAGVRDDFSGLSVEEGLVKALKRLSREGSKADYGFTNYDRFAEIENSLGSKVQYVDVMSPIGIGFRGIKVNSGKQPVTILADITIQSDRLKVMQRNTWELMSLKKSIRVLDQDGNKSLRVSDADAQEIRIGGYKQFVCNAPAWNGNFKI